MKPEEKQIDLRKFYTKFDFGSRVAKTEMKKVQKEIKSVMEGQKIDRIKMLITFN